MRQLLKLIILINLPLFLDACDPVRGYPGPELPPEQIALVKVEYDNNLIDIGRRAADGIEFFGSGINLLPGSHSIEVAFGRVSGPPQCQSSSQIDYYDLRKCQKDDKRYCNCTDFVEVHEYCATPMLSFSCNGFLDVQANSAYQVVVYNYESNKLGVQGPAQASAEEIRCYRGENYIKNDSRYVGRGLSAIISANANNPCRWW